MFALDYCCGKQVLVVVLKVNIIGSLNGREMDCTT